MDSFGKYPNALLLVVLPVVAVCHERDSPVESTRGCQKNAQWRETKQRRKIK